MKNHFSSVCRRKQDSALALVAQSRDDIIHDNEIAVSVKPLDVNHETAHASEISVLPDTGANICLAGDNHMTKMGLNISNIEPCEKNISTAGGFKLKSHGWINTLITLNTHISIQKVYFSRQVHRFYLSKSACIDLHLIPSGFPHCSAISKPPDQPSDVKQCEVPIKPASDKASDVKLREVPTRPAKIPFPPEEKNVEKLELYLKQAFDSSAFNASAPFPEMKDAPPALIHVKSDAKPHAVHVPIPLPLHWGEPLKKKLDEYVLKGTCEKVPTGDRITWCAQMVPVQKKDGSIRLTVDYQKLNAQ